MKDLLLDETFDLTEDAVTNDWVEGLSDYQHKQLILVLPKGSIKESPTATVGIGDYLNDSELDAIPSEVRTCFSADGMIVSKINFNQTTLELTTDANYNN